MTRSTDVFNANGFFLLVVSLTVVIPSICGLIVYITIRCNDKEQSAETQDVEQAAVKPPAVQPPVFQQQSDQPQIVPTPDARSAAIKPFAQPSIAKLFKIPSRPLWPQPSCPSHSINTFNGQKRIVNSETYTSIANPTYDLPIVRPTVDRNCSHAAEQSDAYAADDSLHSDTYTANHSDAHTFIYELQHLVNKVNAISIKKNWASDIDMI